MECHRPIGHFDRRLDPHDLADFLRELSNKFSFVAQDHAAVVVAAFQPAVHLDARHDRLAGAGERASQHAGLAAIPQPERLGHVAGLILASTTSPSSASVGNSRVTREPSQVAPRCLWAGSRSACIPHSRPPRRLDRRRISLREMCRSRL